MVNRAPFESPIFKIEIDGRELPLDVMADVESVYFEEELNTASMFVLKLSISDFDRGTWKFVDLETFSLGKEIKVYMGMDSFVPMMTGEITSIEPTFNKNLSTVDIRGYDRLHMLRFGKKTRTFTDMKDNEIATRIASEHGLSAQVDDTGIKLPYLYQDNQSDLEFLLGRARRIRYEVFADDKKLYFKQSRENDPESMTLKYNVDFDEISLRLSARYEGTKIEVRGWDIMKKEIISAQAQTGDEISMMSSKETGMNMTRSAFGASSTAIVDERILDTSDAEKLAIARYNSHLVESVTGNGMCGGIAELRAGKTVKVEGLGRFSGIYYIISTTHTIDKRGYNTTFKLRRSGV